MFQKQSKIDDLITDVLVRGPQDIKSLIEKIRLVRPKTSKQAVYKALKLLKESEIIIQNKNHVSLSSIWLRKLRDFVEKAELNYKSQSGSDANLVQLKEGEKISYNFKSFEAADIFWGHAFNLLAESMSIKSSVYIYNPHEWFLLARTENELYLFNRLKQDNKRIFLLAGNNSALDLYVSKYFDNKDLNYFASGFKPFSMQNYYVNIFGDFVIEVWLDPKVSGEIEQIYQSNNDFTPGVVDELLKIIKYKGKNKIVISRNKRKSEKIKRIFSKFFLIK